MDITQLFIRITTSLQRLDILTPDAKVVASYPVSTSPLGLGTSEGSLRTPPGRFLVVEKIGHGLPLETVFTGRIPASTTARLEPHARADLVVARIVRLHGLDPDNSNTLDRYIYIHGTNHPELIGQPAGNGCVRMTPRDVAELFDKTRVGSYVEIV